MFLIGDRVRVRERTGNINAGTIGTIAGHREGMAGASYAVDFNFTSNHQPGGYGGRHSHFASKRGVWNGRTFGVREDNLERVDEELRFFARRDGRIIPKYGFATREEGLARFALYDGVTIHEIDADMIAAATRRESRRAADGAFHGLPDDIAARLPDWMKAGHGDASTVVYYASLLDFVCGSQSSCFGEAFVSSRLPTNNDRERAALLERLRESAQGELHLVTEAADIERAFRACADHPLSRNAGALSLPEHPARLLAADGVALAFIGRNHRTLKHTRADAAALVMPERRAFIPIGLPFSPRLREKLERRGWREDAAAFEGLRLRAVPHARKFVSPPLGWAATWARHEGDHLVIDGEGTVHLRSGLLTENYFRCALSGTRTLYVRPAIVNGERVVVSPPEAQNRGYVHAQIDANEMAFALRHDCVQLSYHRWMLRSFAEQSYACCEASGTWVAKGQTVRLKDGRLVARAWFDQSLFICPVNGGEHSFAEGLRGPDGRWFSLEGLGPQAAERVRSAAEQRAAEVVF